MQNMSGSSNDINSENKSWSRPIPTVSALPITNYDNIAERWKKLLISGDWSDCSFSISNEEHDVKNFDCHKVVLASCSPVFGAMLLGPMAENKFPLRIPDITSTAFYGLLMYAYTGKLEKCNDFSQMTEIFVAADKYQMEGLVRDCVDWLCENINPSNVSQMFDLADQYNIKKLKEFCIRLLQDSTGDVLISHAFTNSSTDLVNLLLRQDQLSVKEDQLVEGIMKWASAQLKQQQTGNEEKNNAEMEPSILQDCNDDVLSSPVLASSLVNIHPQFNKLSNSEKLTEEVTQRASAHLEHQQSKTEAGASAEMEPSVSEILSGQTRKNELKKRQCNNSQSFSTVSNKTTQGKKVKNTHDNFDNFEKEVVDLRKVLGSAIQHIRFLAPSLDFNKFIKKYPDVLTEAEISSIQKSREVYNKASIKPCNSDHLLDIYSKDCYSNISAQNSLAEQQKLKPLPNSLINKFSDRISPQYFTYNDDCDKNVKLKYFPLQVFNRVLSSVPNFHRNEHYNINGSFYLCTNRTIMLHGIKVPSQTTPHSENLQSTYQEHIMINVMLRKEDADSEDYDTDDDIVNKYKNFYRGNITFNEIVPYNSSIDIRFPVPYELVKNRKYQIEITFYIQGNYTQLVITSKAKCKETDIKFSFYNSQKYLNSMIQGLIFDTRDQKPGGIPEYCNREYHGSSSSSDNDDSCDMFYEKLQISDIY